MKKIIISTSITVLMIGLSGCISPTPEAKTIHTINDDSLTSYEKTFILNSVVKENKGTVLGIRRYEKFYAKNACLVYEEYPSAVGGVYNKYTYCYTTGSGSSIKTKYNSTNKMFPRDRFNSTISKLNIHIADYYKDEYTKYKSFKTNLMQWNKEAEAKAKAIKIVIIDDTKLLNSELISSISEENKREIKAYTDFNFNNPIKVYKKNITQNNFKVGLNNNTKIINRYSISYTNKIGGVPYLDFPSNVEVRVKKVKFNYMPKIISKGNKEISVTIDTQRNNNNVELTNKTNTYININSLSFYYGKDIITQKIDIKLPPQGIVNATISIDKIQKNKFLPLENIKQVITVGFATEYTNVKYNKQNSLLDLKKVSINNY